MLANTPISSFYLAKKNRVVMFEEQCLNKHSLWHIKTNEKHLWQNNKGKTMEQRQFQQMMLEQLNIHMQKKKSRNKLYTLHKN